MGSRGQSSKTSESAKTKGIASAKSIDEINAHMSAYGIKLDKNMEELPLETSIGIAQAAKETLDAFNYKHDKEIHITVSHALRKDDLASANGQGDLKISSKEFQNLKTLNQNLKQEGNWNIKNATYKSVIAHEIGHMMEHKLLHKVSDVYERGKMQKNATIAKEIIRKAGKQVQSTDYGKGKRLAKLISPVSRYATANRHEALAECVADFVTNGKSATPLSIAVASELKKMKI